MRKWFICNNEIVDGPFPPEEILSQIEAGSIPDEAMVWGPQVDGWKTLTWWKSALPSLEHKHLEKKSPTEWHYAVGKESYGPFNLNQLIEHLRKEKSLAEVYLWRKDMDNWTSIFECADVRDSVGLARRKHPRLPIQGSAIVTHDGQQYIAQLVMVSAGGCGISGVPALKAGMHVKLVLKSQHFFRPLNLEGEIKYTSGKGMMGVEFNKISMEATSAIIDFIRDQLIQVKKSA